VPSLFLDGFARFVVVLHALAAIVLVGAATHHALVAVGFLRGVFKLRLARIYAATVAAAWLITFALGLLAYPTFRYAVRALYMDRCEPWASNLFDVKEYLAAIGIPIVLGVFAMSRVFEPKTDRGLARVYAALTVLVAGIVWFDVISGLVITMVKGV
jgi:predicted anti-sigma-YlaC factor YlaD